MKTVYITFFLCLGTLTFAQKTDKSTLAKTSSMAEQNVQEVPKFPINPVANKATTVAKTGLLSEQGLQTNKAVAAKKPIPAEAKNTSTKLASEQ